MADERTRPTNEDPPQPEAETADQPKGFEWKKLLSQKWFATVLIATVAIHGLGFAYVQWQSARAAAGGVPEITLGEFGFIQDDLTTAGVREAVFSLHISLLGDTDRKARARLDVRRFKVEQDVEQLLRQAEPEDFNDPTLAELKRRIQERINKSLGMRAIAEVIITDLTLDRFEPGAVVGAAKPPGWEKSSG